MAVSHRAKILASNKLKKLGVWNPSELRDIEKWIEEEYNVPEYSIEVYYNGGIHPRLGNRYRLVFTETLDLEKFVRIVEEEENLAVENRRDNFVSVMEVDEYEDDTVVSHHTSELVGLSVDATHRTSTIGRDFLP